MKRGMGERTRGSGRNSCPQVCIYSVIAAGSAQYSSELFKGVCKGAPEGQTSSQVNPQNDNSNDVIVCAGGACFLF